MARSDFGDQFRAQEREKERGNEVATLLTSKQSSGGGLASRRGSGEGDRRRCKEFEMAAALHERKSEGEERGWESARARRSLYRPREGEERSAGRGRGGEARWPAIIGLRWRRPLLAQRGRGGEEVVAVPLSFECEFE